MSTNLAQYKPASASSYVKPFTPERAVDNNKQPAFRWVCNKLPGWLCVDLGAVYYIDRWVAIHMESSGWDNRYNTVDYSLQGSLDNYTWFTLDTVSNNTASVTDRKFTIVQVRYVRVHVTKGLAINPQLASIAELQIYEACSPYLTGLTLSAGTLSPKFSKDITQYNATVSGVSSVTVTPTAEDPQARITVNGINVPSGQPSSSISLNMGNNMITVVSTSSDGASHVNYTIDVTKTEPSANLTKVDVTYRGRSGDVTTTINVVDSQTEYSVDLPDTVNSVTITPYSQNVTASILVNNDQILTSGQVSAAISVAKNMRIPINVTVSGDSISKAYGITIV